MCCVKRLTQQSVKTVVLIMLKPQHNGMLSLNRTSCVKAFTQRSGLNITYSVKALT